MMPLTFVMVCEAQTDFQTASDLSDRVVSENVDWIDATVIHEYRQYQGTHVEVPFLSWTESANLAKVLGRRVHGSGGRQGHHGWWWRKGQGGRGWLQMGRRVRMQSERCPERSSS
jgi:hypothetical protein